MQMELLKHFFSEFRWQDGLDILLNTYILFRLYILFRGTTFFRVILKVCLLWAVGQAAMNLGLILTNWVIQGVIAIAALIVVIIFRNEIAGVLQGRSLRAMLWDIPKTQASLPCETIAESLYEMAGKRIGALIVLPMDQSLDAVIQDGVHLDCKLSQQSLTGIFWPGAPLHDGACIIKGDRIVKAGVILPLSTQKNIPAFFGTRHRAALGLANQTDAMVIVVSEERGEISIFTKDSLRIVESHEDLKEAITSFAGVNNSQTIKPARPLGFSMAALVCLLCVAGLWFSFSRGLETFTIQEVPLEFIKPDQKMEIMNSSVSYAKLHVSGARPLIDALKPDRIKVKLNLSQSRPGKNTLPINRNNISLPPGLRLKAIEPSRVDIFLDTLMEKELPIQPHWTGKLPNDLRLTMARITPSHVAITGGSRILKKIDTIFTEPLSLDHITESGTMEALIVTDPASLKPAGTNTVTVEYTIARREKNSEKQAQEKGKRQNTHKKKTSPGKTELPRKELTENNKGTALGSSRSGDFHAL